MQVSRLIIVSSSFREAILYRKGSILSERRVKRSRTFIIMKRYFVNY